MKIIFITNFMTEHQKALLKAFCSMPDVDYLFIETQEPDGSFQSLNIKGETKCDCVVRFKQFDSDRERYIKLIYEADVVIQGSAPDELINERIKDNKLTFRYRERLYKEGFFRSKYIRDMLAAWLHHGRFRKKSVYMLCASAFTPADCARFGNYKEKCFKFGYFPKTETFDIKGCIEKKRPKSIIWASRFIDWKHPEIPVMIAERLKAYGYDFSLTLYGKGEMFDEISSLIKKKGLRKNVFLDNSKNSDELREIMKSSSIFLHTADRQEGWGAVISEAMNSGCAVVASHIVGSVPYLIENGVNGMIYEDGNINDIFDKIKCLLDDPQKTGQIGYNAYNTIADTWNAETAAERFVGISDAILSGDVYPDLFKDGPCSKAPIIEDNWYKKTGIV